MEFVVVAKCDNFYTSNSHEANQKKFLFFNFASYSPSIAMALKVRNEIACKQTQAEIPDKQYESPLDEPFVVCLVANDLRLYSLILICELILLLAYLLTQAILKFINRFKVPKFPVVQQGSDDFIANLGS
ncbi:unnamed protein product [Porites lobata]|uniref:Uncharacterized protein n=1 Tax=Porites lobata TaxID=104759 RepID=A0ABN8P5A3_9CNID|nr:unnamed protein product [Porites lobata]